MKLSFAVAGLLAFGVQLVSAQRFWDSCNSADLEPWYIERGTVNMVAWCRTRSNSWRRSRLDLNACLTNRNGEIARASWGYFGGSCSDCSRVQNQGGGVILRPGQDPDYSGLGLSNGNIQCNCRRQDGTFILGEQFDLNEVVGNDDGFLRCDGQIATPY